MNPNIKYLIAVGVIAVIIIGVILAFVLRAPPEEMVEEEILFAPPEDEPQFIEIPKISEPLDIFREEILPNITIETKMDIANLVLAQSIDANYNFVVRDNNNYNLGETVLIYHEIVNINSKSLNGIYKVGFDEQAVLIGPDGKEVEFVKEENSASQEFDVDKVGYYFFKLKSDIDTSRLEMPGTYTLKIIVNDKYSDETSEAQISFNVK